MRVRGPALVVLVALAGCAAFQRAVCPAPPEPPPPIVVHAPPSPCLTRPPPTPEPLRGILVGGEGTCPAGVAVCVPAEAALALERNLRDASLWEREAWARCRPLFPDGGAPDAAPAAVMEGTWNHDQPGHPFWPADGGTLTAAWTLMDLNCRNGEGDLAGSIVCPGQAATWPPGGPGNLLQPGPSGSVYVLPGPTAPNSPGK